MNQQLNVAGPLPVPPVLPVAVRKAVRRALSGKKVDADAAARLLMGITADADVDPESLAEVEAVLAGVEPRFWLFLERARDWFSWEGSRVPTRVEDGDPVPALVVKALFADGRVRERAVGLLAASASACLSSSSSASLAAVPVLVLRAGDWVPQVRERAREAIGALLAADPDGAVLAAAAPMALLLAGRHDGRWSADVVTERLAADSAGPVVERLLASADVELRRLAHQVILHRGAAVDADRLLTLLAPDRPAPTRIAAWRLLTSRDSAWRLAVNVMLLDDADETLARRARTSLVAATQQQLYTKPAGQPRDILAAHLPKADAVLPPRDVRLLYFISGIDRPEDVPVPVPVAVAEGRRGFRIFRRKAGRC
ncbi:hypothetical protein ABIA35_003904 [Catenulispora sp. MAP12-49]|uniref:hypothetical protein n=1 Tax=Catenulispora sp. MAP12-49 TaxID=3156302 RepID=UPI0035168427